MEFKHILVPTDFSEGSAEATQYAFFFAKLYGAELHLLYVLEDSLSKIPVEGNILPPPGEEDSGPPSAGLDKLSAALRTDVPADLPLIRATRQGFPADEIVRYADKYGIDLIVMATHGRTGLVHALMGSVAEDVIQKAHCAVLTLRPKKYAG